MTSFDLSLQKKKVIRERERMGVTEEVDGMDVHGHGEEVEGPLALQGAEEEGDDGQGCICHQLSNTGGGQVSEWHHLDVFSALPPSLPPSLPSTESV